MATGAGFESGLGLTSVHISLTAITVVGVSVFSVISSDSVFKSRVKFASVASGVVGFNFNEGILTPKIEHIYVSVMNNTKWDLNLQLLPDSEKRLTANNELILEIFCLFVIFWKKMSSNGI